MCAMQTRERRVVLSFSAFLECALLALLIRNVASEEVIDETSCFQAIVSLALVAATVAALGATRQQPNGKGERFTAAAVNMNAPAGAVTTPVDIVVERWSIDAERDQLMNTMMERGPDKLLDVLQTMPRVGSIRTPYSIGYDLHFARHNVAAGGMAEHDQHGGPHPDD
jgi:hypothetical protein